MSQIAERAGVGRTAVYNHFADKEVLLLAYMREVTGEFARVLTQRLEAEPDPSCACVSTFARICR